MLSIEPLLHFRYGYQRWLRHTIQERVRQRVERGRGSSQGWVRTGTVSCMSQSAMYLINTYMQAKICILFYPEVCQRVL